MANWKPRNQNGRVTTDEMMDNENQMITENLASKVSFLKGIAYDMENETKDQNRYLSGMNTDFDSTQGLLGGSVNRISNMVSSGKNNRKLMCYMILFLVGLFLVSYYLISWVALPSFAKGETTPTAQTITTSTVS